MSGGRALIPCLICNEELKYVNATHLRKHGLTTKEYLRKFPNARLVSDSFRAIKREQNRQLWGNPKFRGIYLENARKAKRVVQKICVRCGQPFPSQVCQKMQVRCPDCQRIYEKGYNTEWYRRYRKLGKEIMVRGMGEVKSSGRAPNMLKHTYPVLDTDGLGTRGTPQMSLRVLTNGRIYATAWLERDKTSLRLGAVKEPDATPPKIPRRRRLPKMVWQTRLMKRCPACGSYSLAVWQENPHCFDCGSELVLARENEYYSVREIACSRCGVVDNTSHYIFCCEGCGEEYRFRLGDDGQEEWRPA